MADAKPSVDSVFCAAIEIESDDERRQYVANVCGQDGELLRQVDRLLQAHFGAGSFLESPPDGVDTFPTIDPAISEKPGTQIGPYKLLQQIGEGGMGVVYMAEQKEPLKRRVALKIIKPGMDSRQVIARFEAERQALAMMDHPNIAKVLDAGATVSGRPYFVMELVNGLPLTRYCDEQQLTLRERLTLFVPICQAVQHAHQKGIIHRDLKPSNILVALYDGQAIPKIIDFGVAKATTQALTEKTMFTQLGQIVGTLEYMSPEQAERNQLDIDTRSDIYSLGVVLYELLTGATPFDRARLRSAAFDELLRIIREEEPSKPSTKVSSSQALPSIAASRRIEPAKLGSVIRGELDWIVMKSLEKNRARRYASAIMLSNDIESYLNNEPVSACPPSKWYRVRKFATRHRGKLAIASLLMIAMLIAVSGIAGSVGWMAREEQVRQGRIGAEVELALEDAERLIQAGELQEANSALLRGRSLLEQSHREDELGERVNLQLRMLEFVDAMEEARLQRIDPPQDVEIQDFRESLHVYEDVFQRFQLDPMETRLSLNSPLLHSIAQSPTFSQRVSACLDDWLTLVWQDPNRKELVSKLVDLTNEIDTDPLNGRIRKAVLQADTKEASLELTSIVESTDIGKHPASTFVLLADALLRLGEEAPVGELLRRAQVRYPNDFWVNYQLANHLRESDAQASLQYYAAALAVKPTNALVLNKYGIALAKSGSPDRAEQVLLSAISIEPDNVKLLHNLGWFYQKTGEREKAVECFHEAIRLDSTYPDAWNSWGNTLLQLREVDAAVEKYQIAISLDPAWSAPRINLGIAYKRQGRLDLAISTLRDVIQQQPTNVSALRALGSALLQDGRHGEAVTNLRKALRIRPNDGTTLRSLAVALVENGDLEQVYALLEGTLDQEVETLGIISILNVLSDHNIEQAFEILKKSVALNPTRSTLQRDFGVACRLVGRHDLAQVHGEKAISLNPRDAEAYCQLGYTLKEMGKTELALARFARVSELDNQDERALVNRCLLHSKLGHHNEAITIGTQAVRLFPDRGGPQDACCFAFLGAGMIDQAIQHGQIAVSIEPLNCKAFNNLGLALREAGRLHEAERVTRRATEIEDSAIYQNNLGGILQELGRIDEAIECFRRALDLNPGNAIYHKNLGLMLREESPSEAEACFLRALEIDPKEVGSYYGLGKIAVSRLYYTKAQDYFQKTVELNPRHVDAVHQLAWLHFKAGEMDRAIERMREALLLDPDDPILQHELGEWLRRSGEIQEAAELLRKSIEQNSSNRLAQRSYGWCQVQLGNWEAALPPLDAYCRLEQDESRKASAWAAMALASWRLSNRVSGPEDASTYHSEFERCYVAAVNGMGPGWERTVPESVSSATWAFRNELERSVGVEKIKLLLLQHLDDPAVARDKYAEVLFRLQRFDDLMDYYKNCLVQDKLSEDLRQSILKEQEQWQNAIGDHFTRVDDWSKAASYYQQAGNRYIERRALSLLLAERQSESADFVQMKIDGFRSATNKNIDWQRAVVIAASIDSNFDVDRSEILAWAHDVFERQPTRSQSMSALALACLRTGHYQLVVNIWSRIEVSGAWAIERDLELAMAHHGTGKIDIAQKLLSDAEKAIASLNKSDVQPADWMRIALIYREARKSLRNDSASANADSYLATAQSSKTRSTWLAPNVLPLVTGVSQHHSKNGR